MKMSTTHKQAELLAYIKAHIADNDGTAPSEWTPPKDRRAK